MSTTIAVIADVHGNIAALHAVLDEIDDNPDIEHIYCIGDMVGIGYETNEVLDLLFSRTDTSFVIGNHATIKITAEDLVVELRSVPYKNHGFLLGYEFLAVPEEIYEPLLFLYRFPVFISTKAIAMEATIIKIPMFTNQCS
ncbi:metallophosphoesterase [Planococcus antarcticus DSM 14505]|uniref:Metallophosphoesterase n=1 Tax=Planococcus antarcticus DSM 14505 TaxID=1185653 RepID=A0AA87ILQ1_9BACL|nr:metallophosphoesterase family protein [Planococcus antarcticus]EIM07015.1 metallophosphoesterase [Planococcus antarcticus DSM 14505]